MQFSRRSETILYAVIALISLVLTGMGLIVVTTFAQSRNSEVTAVASIQAVQVAQAPSATTLPPTGTSTVTLTYTSTNTPTSTSTSTATTEPSNTPQNQSTATPHFVPTETWTATETPTATPSSTPTPTITPSATQTSTPTYTDTPSPTLTVTPTPTTTASATMTPSSTPTPLPTATPTNPGTPTATPTPLSGAVEPAALVPTGDYDIFNVLLLGSDQRRGDGSYRTDTIIVVSINRTTNTVNLLSIPRDLYLYIPGYGQDRINTADIRGDLSKWPGRGPGLLAYTIAYNLGIRIDRYAKVNFDGFKQIVDSLGGIDVAVDCPLTDYRLAAPNLDPNDESNYKLFTLSVGYHHLNGSLALWYARSRETTSDFDRSRRQQLVLRAIWRKALDQGILNNLPTVWSQVMKIVNTNLTVIDAAGLLPIALDLDASRMHSYFLGPGQVTNWTTPDGAEVLLPVPGAIRGIIKELYTPPTENRLVTEQPTLEILNGSKHQAWDKVAASRLAWEGFVPTDAGDAASNTYPNTVIYDYTGNAKPASLKSLRSILGVRRDDVIDAPDPNRAVDFRVILGASYNACTYSAWRSAN